MPEQKTPDQHNEEKLLAVLSYINILCLVPLLTKKENTFIQFHAKQGLVLFVIEMIAMFLSWTIIFMIPAGLIGLVCVIYSVFGIYYVTENKMHPLPGIQELVKKFNI